MKVMAYKIKSSKRTPRGYRFIGVERNKNGSYTVDDGTHKKTYYGYTESEAISKFKKENGVI
jgi:hypothetical protein